ncbi:MAG: radical SAM/SPASM domain-containing protein [Polyangiales bacterium]
MYRYEDVREVHLEVTTRCNASCPQCPRNLSGGPVNPALPMAELSVDDVQKIFPTDFVRRLRKLYACGNYGDPMVASDTLEIFRHLRSENPTMELGMFTNGSGRTASFWQQLAKVVSYVRFSIDGLEDTNHLYRRGTQWARIMESVAAFIGAGGRAEWDFIVFRHNEHQIEEARALAEKLGFRRFFLKKTSRFFSAGRVAGRQVIERDGEPAYVIEEPEDPRFRNPAVVKLTQLGKHTDYQAEADITCKAVAHGRIYVSAEGMVFPCCWTGALYPPGKPAGTAQMWDLVRRLPHGKGSLDARKSSIREIVEGPFFQELVPGGWPKRSIQDGRLEPCVRACGHLDTHAAQYGESLL